MTFDSLLSWSPHAPLKKEGGCVVTPGHQRGRIAAHNAKICGDHAMQEHFYEEAIVHYSCCVEWLAPLLPSKLELARIYCNRCSAFIVLQKYPKAVSDAAMATSLAPTWSLTWCRRGASLFCIGHIREAEECFLEGLKFDPHNQALREGLKESRRALQQFSSPSSPVTSSSSSSSSSSSVASTPSTTSAVDANDMVAQALRGKFSRLANGDGAEELGASGSGTEFNISLDSISLLRQSVLDYVPPSCDPHAHPNLILDTHTGPSRSSTSSSSASPQRVKSAGETPPPVPHAPATLPVDMLATGAAVPGTPSKRKKRRKRKGNSPSSSSSPLPLTSSLSTFSDAVARKSTTVPDMTPSGDELGDADPLTHHQQLQLQQHKLQQQQQQLQKQQRQLQEHKQQQQELQQRLEELQEKQRQQKKKMQHNLRQQLQQKQIPEHTPPEGPAVLMLANSDTRNQSFLGQKYDEQSALASARVQPSQRRHGSLDSVVAAAKTAEAAAAAAGAITDQPAVPCTLPDSDIRAFLFQCVRAAYLTVLCEMHMSASPLPPSLDVPPLGLAWLDFFRWVIAFPRNPPESKTRTELVYKLRRLLSPVVHSIRDYHPDPNSDLELLALEDALVQIRSIAASDKEERAQRRRERLAKLGLPKPLPKEKKPKVIKAREEGEDYGDDDEEEEEDIEDDFDDLSPEEQQGRREVVQHLELYFANTVSTLTFTCMNGELANFTRHGLVSGPVGLGGVAPMEDPSASQHNGSLPDSVHAASRKPVPPVTRAGEDGFTKRATYAATATYERGCGTFYAPKPPVKATTNNKVVSAKQNGSMAALSADTTIAGDTARSDNKVSPIGDEPVGAEPPFSCVHCALQVSTVKQNPADSAEKIALSTANPLTATPHINEDVEESSTRARRMVEYYTRTELAAVQSGAHVAYPMYKVAGPSGAGSVYGDGYWRKGKEGTELATAGMLRIPPYSSNPATTEAGAVCARIGGSMECTYAGWVPDTLALNARFFEMEGEAFRHWWREAVVHSNNGQDESSDLLGCKMFDGVMARVFEESLVSVSHFLQSRFVERMCWPEEEFLDLEPVPPTYFPASLTETASGVETCFEHLKQLVPPMKEMLQREPDAIMTIWESMCCENPEPIVIHGVSLLNVFVPRWMLYQLMHPDVKRIVAKRAVSDMVSRVRAERVTRKGNATDVTGHMSLTEIFTIPLDDGDGDGDGDDDGGSSDSSMGGGKNRRKKEQMAKDATAKLANDEDEENAAIDLEMVKMMGEGFYVAKIIVGVVLLQFEQMRDLYLQHRPHHRLSSLERPIHLDMSQYEQEAAMSQLLRIAALYPNRHALTTAGQLLIDLYRGDAPPEGSVEGDDSDADAGADASAETTSGDMTHGSVHSPSSGSLPNIDYISLLFRACPSPAERRLNLVFWVDYGAAFRVWWKSRSPEVRLALTDFDHILTSWTSSLEGVATLLNSDIAQKVCWAHEDYGPVSPIILTSVSLARWASELRRAGEALTLLLRLGGGDTAMLLWEMLCLHARLLGDETVSVCDVADVSINNELSAARFAVRLPVEVMARLTELGGFRMLVSNIVCEDFVFDQHGFQSIDSRCWHDALESVAVPLFAAKICLALLMETFQPVRDAFMMTEAVRRTYCKLCGNSVQTIKRCGRCSDATYCSRDCQVADWPTHKELCHSKSTRDTVFSLAKRNCIRLHLKHIMEKRPSQWTSKHISVPAAGGGRVGAEGGGDGIGDYAGGFDDYLEFTPEFVEFDSPYLSPSPLS